MSDSDWRVNLYRKLPKKQKRMYRNLQLGEMASELKKWILQVRSESAWREIIDSYGDLNLGVASPDNVVATFRRHGIRDAEIEAQRFINFILRGLV